MVLLLDQLPRNCYRGDEAAQVFSFFDPLARDVANAAIDQGVPDSNPEIRWVLCYRMWFYVPMMHSEDLPTHERAIVEYERLAADVESLITEPEVEGQNEHRQRAARLMAGNPEKARAMMKQQVDVEKQHADIIRQFGRYPHRNKALKREPTTEELEYLANGGETFGGGSEKK